MMICIPFTNMFIDTKSKNVKIVVINTVKQGIGPVLNAKSPGDTGAFLFLYY